MFVDLSGLEFRVRTSRVACAGASNSSRSPGNTTRCRSRTELCHTSIACRLLVALMKWHTRRSEFREADSRTAEVVKDGARLESSRSDMAVVPWHAARRTGKCQFPGRRDRRASSCQTPNSMEIHQVKVQSIDCVWTGSEVDPPPSTKARAMPQPAIANAAATPTAATA